HRPGRRRRGGEGVVIDVRGRRDVQVVDQGGQRRTVDERIEVRRGSHGAVAGGRVIGVGRAGGVFAVDVADAGDVVGGQGVFRPGVAGVHDRAGTGAAVAQAQCVADFVRGHGEQVVRGAEVEGLPRVEGDVAGDGVVVRVRGVVVGGQRGIAE